jgi:hypothetical protein
MHLEQVQYYLRYYTEFKYEHELLLADDQIIIQETEVKIIVTVQTKCHFKHYCIKSKMYKQKTNTTAF